VAAGTVERSEEGTITHDQLGFGVVHGFGCGGDTAERRRVPCGMGCESNAVESGRSWVMRMVLTSFQLVVEGRPTQTLKEAQIVLLFRRQH
jgi:hypothetical protein